MRQPSDVIQQLDERLQQHDQFARTPKIVARVVERYKFALALLASEREELRALAERVERLHGAAADALFGDILVRAELEAAIGRIEARAPVDASSASLRWLLGEALGLPEGARPGVAYRAMARAFPIGPGGAERRTWVWDLPEASAPVVDRLRESIRTGFMPGAEASVEIIRPTPRMVEQLDQACSLLCRLVPRTADSVLQHLHSIAVASIRGPRGRLLTGSGGDGTPCMIFIDPDELDNPWDTAGHILHEAVHLKLSDLIRAGAIVADEGLIDLPWGRRTMLSNCVFAYHAYAHMHLFRAAVEHLGPALHAEFGAPSDYWAPAHAMSVVNNSATAPFSRAVERLEHLHEQLAGPLAPRLTPVGRALAAWLWDALEPAREQGNAGAGIERSAPVAPAPEALPPAPPSSRRYRHGRDLAVRRSPVAEALFALEPGSRRIVTLNLSAWLAFELCDGKTERDVLSHHAAATGLDPEHAWRQLAPALHQLEASGMIVPVPESQATSPTTSAASDPGVVRAADLALVQHPTFGDSAIILAKVLARYRFGIELFAARLPAVARVAPAVERLNDDDVRRVCFDPLVRLALEQAFADLEAGTLASPHRLDELLPAAVEVLPLGLCESRMPARRRVGRDAPKWLWDAGQSSDPYAGALRAIFDGVFADRADLADRAGRAGRPSGGGTLLTPDARAQEMLEAAIELLETLLPHAGASALRHVDAIALLSARIEGGTVLSAAGGDLTPSTVFLSLEDLGNPWDVAGCLLHEGLHMKLFDAARSVALATWPAETIQVPWRDVRWSIVRAIFAYHVYVHLSLFKAAAQAAVLHQPRLIERFGDPSTYVARPHAMSVVRNGSSDPGSNGAAASPGRPFGRSIDRARYLGTCLQGPWAHLLSAEGRALVHWLHSALAPVDREVFREPEAVTAGDGAHLTYQKAPGLATRAVEQGGCMMAFSPAARQVRWLDLNAWLIFELSDGRTPAEIERAYLEIIGDRMPPDEARRQLRSGLDHLVSSRLIEATTQPIGGAS